MQFRRPIEGIPAGITAHAQPIIPEALDGMGMTLWLAADSAAGVTKNGDSPPKVSSWADDSGTASGPFVKATDAEKPTWIANAYNGKPTLRGIGTPGGLTSTVAVSLGTACSLWFALKRGSLASYDIASTGSTGDILENTSGANVEWFGNTTDRNNFSLNATGLHIYCITQTNAAALTLYMDGAQVFTKTAGAVLEDIKHLFGRVSGLSGANCDIPEIILAPSVVSAAKRGIVTAYLGAKYGVTVV